MTKGTSFQNNQKTYDLLFKKYFKYFAGIADEKFIDSESKPTEYIFSAPLHRFMDMVLKVEDEYYNFEFQTGTLKEEDFWRFDIYRYMLMLEYKTRKVNTVILYTEKVDMEAYYEYNQDSYKPIIFSFKEYNGDEILNKINNKIKNNEEITQMDELHLAFLPLYETKIDIKERLYELVLMVNDLKTIEEEKKERIKLMQFRIVEKFIPEEEMGKYTDVITMNSVALQQIVNEQLKGQEEQIMEKGRLQGKKEGRKEGKIEGLEEGIIVGKKEGKREGLEEGIIVGKKEGKREGIKEAKLDLAKAMLQENEPIPKIIRLTGVSKEDINTIQNNILKKASK